MGRPCSNVFRSSLSNERPDHRLFWPTYVYALIDPRDGKVRYIGCTINAGSREYQHRNPRSASKLVRQWSSELEAEGLKFVFAVLETCDGYEKGADRERELIKLYRKVGAPIFNGGPNHPHVRQLTSPEPVVSFY